MWLVLCSTDDIPALWVAMRLRARGVTPLVILTPELLHYSSAWEHRLSNRAPMSIAFTLADGSRIDGAAIRGVLNRLTVLPLHLFDHLTDADRSYALQEWTALHISWLSCLTVPVLNRPVMQGLCGAWRHPSEWTWLASQAGLETFAYGQGAPSLPVTAPPSEPAGPVRTVLVVDGQAIDDVVPDEVAAACGRLGELAQTRLIGVDVETHGWRFTGASPRPDLRLGGEAFVSAIGSTMGGV